MSDHPIQPVNTKLDDLVDPWMIAVWPGIGAVAPGAGGYLVNALGAEQETTLETDEFFTTDFINVSDGIISRGNAPRTMFFVWKDPAERHDLLLLIGEGQPDTNHADYCNSILDYAKQRGVSRVFTFAAMATNMNPAKDPRVFGAVTNSDLFDEVELHDVQPLANGRIGGLNGLLLASAGERDIDGICLMGELPYYAANLPNPKSALAVLRAFTDISDIHVDLTEIAMQAEQIEPRLLELRDRIAGQADSDDESEDWEVDEFDEVEDHLNESERAVIEMLFEKAQADRTQAEALKNELDRA